MSIPASSRKSLLRHRRVHTSNPFPLKAICSLVLTPKPVIVDVDSSNTEAAEAKRVDLELLLKVMRCQHNICMLENELAHARVQENIMVGNLYRFRANEAEKRLEGTEFDLGCVCNAMCKNTSCTHGYKHCHISNPSSKPGKYSVHPTKSTSYSICQHLCCRRLDSSYINHHNVLCQVVSVLCNKICVQLVQIC